MPDNTSGSTIAGSVKGPRVGAYALIGHEDRLLIIEHPYHHSLPGGIVNMGESVEQALRRTLRDQLGAIVAQLDFCVVIEHPVVPPGQPPTSELAFLFDVTLTNHDHLAKPGPSYRWATNHELSLLRPEIIRTELVAGTLSVGPSWRGWTP